MPFEYCYSLQGFGFLFVLFCFVLPFQILFHRFYLFLGNCLEACKLCIFLNLFHYLFLLSCLSLFFYHLALSLFFTFSLIFFKFFFLIPCFLSSSFLPSCPYSLVFLFFPIFFSITFVFHQEKKCVSYSNFSDYRSVFDARKRVKKIWNSSRVREHQKQKSQEVFFYQYLLEFFRLADSLHFEMTVSERCWEREKS